MCEDAEMSWIFMVADAVAINQLWHLAGTIDEDK